MLFYQKQFLKSLFLFEKRQKEEYIFKAFCSWPAVFFSMPHLFPAFRVILEGWVGLETGNEALGIAGSLPGRSGWPGRASGGGAEWEGGAGEIHRITPAAEPTSICSNLCLGRNTKIRCLLRAITSNESPYSKANQIQTLMRFYTAPFLGCSNC